MSAVTGPPQADKTLRGMLDGASLRGSESALDEARLLRDAHDWAIKTTARGRCENCDESLRGLAVFECSGQRCPTGMYCCSTCASLVVRTVVGPRGDVLGVIRERVPLWTRVVLVRSGRTARGSS